MLNHVNTKFFGQPTNLSTGRYHSNLWYFWQQSCPTVYFVLGCVTVFIRPSSDRTYYSMVMSVRPSIRPSARFPHISPTCFNTCIMWNGTYSSDKDFFNPVLLSDIDLLHAPTSHQVNWKNFYMGDFPSARYKQVLVKVGVDMAFSLHFHWCFESKWLSSTLPKCKAHS